MAIQKRLSKAPQLISSSSPPAAGLKDSLQFLSFNFQLFSKKLQHPQKRKVGLNGKLCKEECAVVGADAQQLHCKVSVGGRGGWIKLLPHLVVYPEIKAAVSSGAS